MNFGDIPIYDDDVLKLLARFSFNIFFLFLIVKLAIRPTTQDRDFAFSVVMMNVAVFFICFALKKLELGLGMALGLFAIFGVLRYRAEAINNKEMTYLFIVIAIAVINALSNQKTSFVELILINSIILTASLVKESTFLQFLFLSKPSIADKNAAIDSKGKAKKDDGKSNEKSSLKRSATENDPSPDVDKNDDDKKAAKRKLSIVYDRLELLAPVHAEALLHDLQQRTGLPIQRLRVQDVDLTTKSATISVWLADADSE
ncbi:MAG: DUF4956 domain-containing protein [Planctomycetaceae bacterium]|jgi:multisubunit Na+/H+ antiporter MnhF subunit|nr:DUF4956 domain-containing protein [Planctomycetaceae bacterium]